MKNTKSFQERFNRWKNGENYWDIVGKPLRELKPEKETIDQALRDYLDSIVALYEGGKDGNQQQVFRGNKTGQYFNENNEPLYVIDNNERNTNPRTWTFGDYNGKVYNPTITNWNIEKERIAQQTSDIEQENSRRNNIADAIGEITSFIPGVGDTKDALVAAKDLYNEQYSKASLGLAALLLPNIIQKPLNTFGRNVLKVYNKSALPKPSLFYKNLYNDVKTDLPRVINETRKGLYPWTFSNLRKQVSLREKEEKELIMKALAYDDNRLQKRMLFMGYDENDLNWLRNHKYLDEEYIYNNIPKILHNTNRNKPPGYILNNYDGKIYTPKLSINRNRSNFYQGVSDLIPKDLVPGLKDDKITYGGLLLHEFDHVLQKHAKRPYRNFSTANTNGLFITYAQPDEKVIKHVFGSIESSPFENIVLNNRKKLDIINNLSLRFTPFRINRTLEDLVKHGELIKEHDLSPNELLSELTRYLLQGNTSDAEMYNYLGKRFKVSPDNIDFLINNGFDRGKDNNTKFMRKYKRISK